MDAGLKRALLSFGAARALNAVLSVLQGTEVSVQPLGLGVTLSLGQVLEPANRMVEQFSSVMLFASVAFGVEKILVAIGSWWPVSAALAACSVAWSIMLWRHGAPGWLSRLLVLLLMVRFAVPVAMVGTNLLFEEFLRERYVASQKVLEETPARVQRLAPVDEYSGPGRSIWDRVKDAATAPVKEVKQRYDAIQAAAEQAIERMIQLIVVFTVQTVVLPLLLFWGLAQCMHPLMAFGAGARAERARD